MPNYDSLSQEISDKIQNNTENGIRSPFAFADKNVVRRNPERDKPSALRPPFIRDTDKILHCPFYNRYADKTQVFSFYKNDDISRRGLHVQLVSRISRTLGRALGLNLELIEAIALGHDIGHTPFGHAGENFLDQIYSESTGKHFSHNIHSVRVLDGIFPYNISLQTLNGIAAHDGEFELSEYRPVQLTDFEQFDSQIEKCHKSKEYVKTLVPCTLEGCVVRISDIIAYLGKDRQDALRAHLVDSDAFQDDGIGTINAEIINNLIVNIVENSYGKPYIKMDASHFDALKKAKSDNYALIYNNKKVEQTLKSTVKPMFAQMYGKLYSDFTCGIKSSPIFTHHINYVNSSHYKRDIPYEQSNVHTIIVDYIASMTDDYFIDLFDYLFPKSTYKIKYNSYFE